jgi:hypothetical protein
MNCENNIKSPISNINNIINSNNSGSNKINNIIIENDNNNGNKNFLKLNRIDNTKNYGNFNISNRNRNYMNYDGDRYSNRKNKNMNINNNLNTNNNNSLNEKSNSLSIISEKISLLNSYEDNSNSLLKEERERERESTKEKKIFSAKMKIDNYNSEKNAKNYFNIIESEIKEENENIKNDKNKIFKNRRFNSILHQKKKYEENQRNKSINALSPKIYNDIDRKQYNNSTISNETTIRIDDSDINNRKNNNINAEEAHIPKREGRLELPLPGRKHRRGSRGRPNRDFCGLCGNVHGRRAGHARNARGAARGHHGHAQWGAHGRRLLEARGGAGRGEPGIV